METKTAVQFFTEGDWSRPEFETWEGDKDTVDMLKVFEFAEQFAKQQSTSQKETIERLREDIRKVKKTISKCLSIKDLWTYPEAQNTQFEDEAKALNSMLNELEEVEQLLKETEQ